MSKQSQSQIDALLNKLVKEARTIGKLTDNVSRDGIVDQYAKRKMERSKAKVEALKKEIRLLFDAADWRAEDLTRQIQQMRYDEADRAADYRFENF
jgi:hypothetical protein